MCFKKSTKICSTLSITLSVNSVFTQYYLLSSKATSFRTGYQVTPLGKFCIEDKHCPDAEICVLLLKLKSLRMQADKQLTLIPPALKDSPKAIATEIFQYHWQTFQKRNSVWIFLHNHRCLWPPKLRPAGGEMTSILLELLSTLLD